MLHIQAPEPKMSSLMWAASGPQLGLVVVVVLVIIVVIVELVVVVIVLALVILVVEDRNISSSFFVTSRVPENDPRRTVRP